MTILRPAETTQTITIIPRYDVASISVKLRNESQATAETFENVDTTYGNGYMTFDIRKSVKEGENYEIELIDNETIIFRGKCFSTDATDLENYKINQ